MHRCQHRVNVAAIERVVERRRRSSSSLKRRRPESNRCKRLCRPLRNHSATSPGAVKRSDRVTASSDRTTSIRWPVSLDADRLAAAYERDGRRLLVFVTGRTYDAQLAVDLVAETYARAFELRRRFAADPTDPDALAAWVFGIARNVLHEAAAPRPRRTPCAASLGIQPPQLDAEEQARMEDLATLGELRSP
jgi:hypothetical protein